MMGASAPSESKPDDCNTVFKPTHMLGGVSVREVAGQAGAPDYLDAQGVRHEAGRGRRPRPLDVTPNYKKPRVRFPAKACTVALQAAYGFSGMARDEDDNMAVRVADRLVELSLYQPRDRSHRRLLVRVPAAVELEIVKEL
jgi:hypothetical protein